MGAANTKNCDDGKKQEERTALLALTTGGQLPGHLHRLSIKCKQPVPAGGFKSSLGDSPTALTDLYPVEVVLDWLKVGPLIAIAVLLVVLIGVVVYRVRRGSRPASASSFAAPSLPPQGGEQS